MKKKVFLSYFDRSSLYSVLVDRENFPNRMGSSDKTISDFISELIRKYIIPEEKLEIYKKSKRIFNYKTAISLDLKCLWPGLLDIGTCVYDYTYPNNILPKIGYIKGKNKSIRMKYSFYIKNEDLIIPFFYKTEGSSIFVLGEEEFDKIPEKDLSILKNLLIDCYDIMYERENFLIDHFKHDEFIGDIKSLKQLKIYNEDWYNIFLEKCIDRENKHNNNTNKLFPEDDIKLTLENLKAIIIESKKILRKNLPD